MDASRIQHNIVAMSAYRNYKLNSSALAKNLEKLSSGYKINRAGDDAAGLAISEKMRAQISGLNVASKNAKDGISLVQTAEGALTEVHDMLNRMVTLAEQSANGTYADDVDREQLQKEVEQLRTEINRIADSANFNGINLLDGSMDAANNKAGTVTAGVADTTANGAKTLSIVASTAGSIVGPTATVFHADGAKTEKAKFSVKLDTVSFGGTGDNDDFTITLSSVNGTELATMTLRRADIDTTGTGVTATKVATAMAVEYDQELEINGQLFKVTAGNDGYIEFEQYAEPTSASEVVDPHMLVNLSSKDYSYINTATYASNGTSATGLSVATDAYTWTEGVIASTDGAAYELFGSGTKTITFKAKVVATTAGTISSNANLVISGLTNQISGDGYKLMYKGADDALHDLADGNIAFNGSTGLATDASAVKVYVVTASLADGAATSAAVPGSTNTNGSVTTAGTLILSFNIDISEADVTTASNAKEMTVTLGATADTTRTDNAAYNYGTTILTEGGYGNGDRLANTAVEATTKNLGIKDGSVLEVGGERYIFAVGTDSAYLKANAGSAATYGSDGLKRTITINGSGSNATATIKFTQGTATATLASNVKVVDLSRMKVDSNTGVLSQTDLANALTQLSREVGSKNKMFTIGYDDTGTQGRLTFSEKPNYYKNAAGTAVNDGAIKLDETNLPNQFKFYSDGITAGDGTQTDGKFAAKNLVLQIGDTSESMNQLTVEIKDMHAAAMGIGSIDISTQAGAQEAINKIKDAINYVSDMRGTLGATQNRLDHTINNLNVMVENIQDAESTIRDTDVAEEMMAYTKNSILVQAAQAMLAQANQLPQGVLQLLS